MFKSETKSIVAVKLASEDMNIPLKINVKEEYRKLLPPLSKAEYEALKASIKENGLYDAITINREGVILDGYHRFKACMELGIKPKYEVIEFENPLLEKIFVIETNIQRRQLNDFQKVEMSLPLLEIESELAKERQYVGRTLVPFGTKGKASEIIAKRIGVSARTYFRGKAIIEKGSEKLKKSVRKGETSIAYAYKIIKKLEWSRESPPLPSEVFNVIYADPPWRYELPLRGDPELHYPTMLLEDICNLKVPVADDAVLFLWTTNPHLEEALKVMNAWGFAYKTNMVWIKDKIGTGHYFRAQHELLLVGKKGDMPSPPEEYRHASVLKAPREGHSDKPEIIYEIIEKMYPNGKYLELFARKKRKGWVSWGKTEKLNVGD